VNLKNNIDQISNKQNVKAPTTAKSKPFGAFPPNLATLAN